MSSSFQLLDVSIVVAYLSALAAVGAYFSRRRQSVDELLVASRRMPWLAVGLSLMAALNSGIDYLTQPSATIQYGLVLVVGVLSWVIVYAWVSKVVLPFYRRLEFYSVYEYLEARFDVRVRLLGAGIFILWRLGWMATALYVPALAVNAATNGAVHLTALIVVLGVLVTLYTTFGGIQAVIWNDVLQFCVMFGGLAATIAVVVSSVPGGMGEIWTTAAGAGKTALWVPIAGGAFFTQPMTLPALLMALIVGRMAQYTSDQVLVQRLQTTRSVADARQAFIVHAAGDALWMIGLSLVGLTLFAYFQYRPGPADLPPDRLLPYFMAQAFPSGATGLVIAAILAASLSSVDSAIHSCSSVIYIDFYRRILQDRVPAAGGRNDEHDNVRVSRLINVIVGVAGTTLACNVASIGTLLEIANKLINAFTGPLFGIFLLAMFSRRATSVAALAGGVTGAMVAYGIAYHSSIGFLWPSTFGLAATLGVGVLVTLVRGAVDTGARFTWRAVMNAPGQAAASP
jgi:SSS family transporter